MSHWGGFSDIAQIVQSRGDSDTYSSTDESTTVKYRKLKPRSQKRFLFLSLIHMETTMTRLKLQCVLTLTANEDVDHLEISEV